MTITILWSRSYLLANWVSAGRLCECYALKIFRLDRIRSIRGHISNWNPKDYAYQIGLSSTLNLRFTTSDLATSPRKPGEGPRGPLALLRGLGGT